MQTYSTNEGTMRKIASQNMEHKNGSNAMLQPNMKITKTSFLSDSNAQKKYASSQMRVLKSINYNNNSGVSIALVNMQLKEKK